jgi:hypothetical protein
VGFGQDEPIALGPVGVFGVELHVMKVQGGDKLNNGHRATGVSHLRGLEDFEAVPAQHIRRFLKILNQFFIMRHVFSVLLS